MVKNLVRRRLDHRGLPCLLTGDGHGFPVVLSVKLIWLVAILSSCKLGLDLAIAGRPAPVFCPDAK